MDYRLETRILGQGLLREEGSHPGPRLPRHTEGELAHARGRGGAATSHLIGWAGELLILRSTGHMPS